MELQATRIHDYENVLRLRETFQATEARQLSKNSVMFLYKISFSIVPIVSQ